MEDLRDPYQAEWLQTVAPDEYLRRRDFLQRAAMTAGVGAGLGTMLSSETLVAEAAKAQHKVKLPSPKNIPIDTFVVLMMENRSFDHYLGWLPGADGRQVGLKFKDKQGKTHTTQHLAPDWQGCAHPDPDHSWEGGRQQLAGGKVNGFLRSGDNDVFSISYYDKKDLGFTPHIAQAFTTYDRFFCSLLASTYPNREYMHSAQSYGKKDNGLPNPSFPDSTIFAALKKKGISNRYYYSDLPVSAFWGAPGLARSSKVSEFYDRAEKGTLPALSFVDPSFVNEGGGTSGDEHPHGDVRVGQAFISDVVHAVMESPQWKRTALFVIYDEWGGFFEHVRPPRVPDVRSSRNPNEDFGQMGFRIPAVIVSPWAKRKHVDHGVYGFESILKFIRYRFGLPPLTLRDAKAHNIGYSFDFESKPRLTPPSLPHPAHVAGAQCPGRAPGLTHTDEGVAERPNDHDMIDLVNSGYLDRLGFHYTPATPDVMFREPSKVVAAHQAAG